MGYMLESDGRHPRPDFKRDCSTLLRGGNCWVKLSGPYRIAKDKAAVLRSNRWAERWCPPVRIG